MIIYCHRRQANIHIWEAKLLTFWTFLIKTDLNDLNQKSSPHHELSCPPILYLCLCSSHFKFSLKKDFYCMKCAIQINLPCLKRWIDYQNSCRYIFYLLTNWLMTFCYSSNLNYKKTTKKLIIKDYFFTKK